ncbi:alpha/beta hydrolase [Nocardia cyriacigeorgica]|uniref:alpha/beta hydrolase n=1 Tax=Nocardia cyriacigeorgica TaxID=135487 RepID=UPI00397F8ED3
MTAPGITDRSRYRIGRGDRRRAMFAGPDVIGLSFALVFLAWSLSPSLLPRGWVVQGVLSGLAGATGYGVGLALAFPVRRWIVPRLSWWPLPSRRAERILPLMVVAGAAAMAAGTAWAAADWQRDLAVLVGMPSPATLPYVRTTLLGAAIFGTVLFLARGLTTMTRGGGHWLRGRAHLPPIVAHAVVPLVMLLVVVFAVDEVDRSGSSGAARRVFGAQDGTAAGVVQPQLTERSGSPGSRSGWDTLGMPGQLFVSGGRTAMELATINGAPAREPIRVYAGLASAADTAARVELVLDELDRTAAWDRKILVVAGTTGAGKLDPIAVDSVELMYNGDTAIAAMQYSSLPSWPSLLVDRAAADAAGAALVDGIRQRWSQLPPDRRPRLVVYGEGLGAQSIEAAFDGLGELRRSVDGALFVGPNSDRLWRSVKDRRDPGTTEVLPTYSDGLVIRFAATRQDLVVPTENALHTTSGPWAPPRVLYLQHSSDPTVWWDPALLFSRPDWLSEPPGTDRSPAMRWYPFVTFGQVTADLARAQTSPPGHGHNYADLIPYAWAAVAAPQGWSEADTERIARAIVMSPPDR